MSLNYPSANSCSCKLSCTMSPQLQTFILRGKALKDLPPLHQGFTLARVKATGAETYRCKNHSPLTLKASRWDNKRYPLCGSAWRITDARPHHVILSPGVARVNCEFFGCMCTCTKENFQIPWTNSTEPFFFLSLPKEKQQKPFRGRCVKVWRDWTTCRARLHGKLRCRNAKCEHKASE